MECHKMTQENDEDPWACVASSLGIRTGDGGSHRVATVIPFNIGHEHKSDIITSMSCPQLLKLDCI